jgi:hypothetical protein
MTALYGCKDLIPVPLYIGSIGVKFIMQATFLQHALAGGYIGRER